ncbi:TonB-dependent receptor [Xanthomonas cucurbitae]|nr:TonB-dependent receptor [Xanthomonas cucurbitae]
MQDARRSCRRCIPLLTGLAIAMALLPTEHAVAQQATGTLYGTVSTNEAAQVVIRNTGTGASQTRTPNRDGRFSVDGLVPGQYRVELQVAGRSLDVQDVVVRPGSATQVAELASGDKQAATLDTVQVRADAVNNAADNTVPIDVTTPVLVRQYSEALFRKTGVDTSGASDGGSYNNLLTQLPQIYMAQVTTGQGSGLASFNGGSGTETRYYINEFDTTFDYTGAGASSVPGDMIGSAQVIANGASAKYSNAMGGSVSATTKSGDNTLRAGFASSIGLPPSRTLNPRVRPYLIEQRNGVNRYYYQDQSTNGSTETSFNNTYFLSGPLLNDKLFFNVVLQNNRPQSQSSFMAGEVGEEWRTFRSAYNNPALNLSWVISDAQQFDLTAARSDRKNYTSISTLAEPSNPASERSYLRDILFESHDAFYLGRYRWQLNDTMNLSLMAGYFSHMEKNSFSDSGLYAVRFDEPGGVANVLANGVRDSEEPVTYHKRGFRADYTWQLGEHKLQLGAEHYDLSFDSLSLFGRNGDYTYLNYGRDQDRAMVGDLVVPANTPILLTHVGRSGGPLGQVNRGGYVEDYWQAADHWVVYGGVRRDNSGARLANGRNVLDLYTTSPRLGVSWDVRGDSTMKLGASAGIYTMPVPGVILTSLFNDFSDAYVASTYAGINPDGTPIAPRQIGTYTNASIIGEPVTLTSRNLRNARQDSYTLYLQDNQLLPHWSSTLEFNHSSVKRALAVWNDLSSGLSSPAYKYLQSLGFADPHLTNNMLVNPGSAVVIDNDLNGDGQRERVTLPGLATGLAKPRREIYSTSLELVHPETPEQPVFLLFGYTWKHVYGNYEGYYGETNGNVLGAPNFRYASLSAGNNGDLPADVRHVLRFNGSHTFGASGLSLGLGAVWQSGAPRSCYSQYPDPTDAAYDAGPSAFYCDGVAVSRGSLGRFPSWWTLDMNAAYERHWGPQMLRLELLVNNLLNQDTEVASVPFYGSYAGQVNGQPTWERDRYYGAKREIYPRTTGLILRYNWN